MAESEDSAESEESDVEWEDVETMPNALIEPTLEQLEALKTCQDGAGLSQTSSQAQAGSLEIVLERKAKNKNKKEDDYLKKAIAAFNRKVRCDQHKVHLLCLVARGLYLSRQCDDPIKQGLLLSLLGSEAKELIRSNAEEHNQTSILRIIKWMTNRITVLHQTLRESVSRDGEYRFFDEQLLVTLLRALGLRVRLVMVLNPTSYKESKASTNGKRKSIDTSERRQSKSGNDVKKESENTSKSSKSKGSTSGGCGGSPKVGVRGKRQRKSTEKDELSSTLPSNSQQTGRKTRRQSQPTNEQKRRRSGNTTTLKKSPYFNKASDRGSKLSKTSSGEMEVEMEEEGYPKEGLKCEESSGSESEYVPDNERSLVPSKKRGLRRSSSSHNMDDSDSDFQPPKKKKQRRSSKSTGATPSKKLKEACERTNKKSDTELELKGSSKNAPTASSSGGLKCNCEDGQCDSKDRRRKSESVEVVKSEETACWAEVYLKVEEGGSSRAAEEKRRKKWTCVHLPSCSVDQPHLCEKHCTLPLNYVIAVEKGCTVRDVTARYASNWCTYGHKQRLSDKWWEESLRPFEPTSQDERDAEEEDILSMLYAQPLPTSINDYKNHPLYALKRHLLKFEAIYPEDSKAVGRCKGEPVYARESVHTLHTRETWLKEGRVVRVGEKAYKMVKARPKRGQSTLDGGLNSTVEVFGEWQTEVYMAPPVVDGKVPRNEYGNIELFLPSMLPPGACHIKIQGIQKVARKLDIDFAPAMVGWDFHSGYCHPILDGIVVAMEYEDVLKEAWQQQEQLLIEKDIKKREQRVLDRWRKMTRGVLIRERVKRTYEMVNTS